MYLVIITVPNEREDRMKRVASRGEAAAYVAKLKSHLDMRNIRIQAEVYNLGEPVESFT